MSKNEKSLIRLSELDTNFKDEIANEPGGEGILRCYACGTCAASCPVREINERYNPRKIIRMAILGMRKEVLSNDFIWLCSTCYDCSERCPQDVKVAEIMNSLKNIAVREGYIHPSFILQLNALYNHGRIYEVWDIDNERRVKLDLPEIKEKPAEIQKLLRQTGLSKVITAIKEGEK